MYRPKTSPPRCVTPALDEILAGWKQEPNPYDDPAYEVPTYQREKLIPQPSKKEIRCATPAINEISKLEAEFEKRWQKESQSLK